MTGTCMDVIQQHMMAISTKDAVFVENAHRWLRMDEFGGKYTITCFYSQGRTDGIISNVAQIFQQQSKCRHSESNNYIQSIHLDGTSFFCFCQIHQQNADASS